MTERSGPVIEMIRVDRIEPNPWNPNVMGEEGRRAARESIEEYGFVDPVQVRKHPEKRGWYQMVNGQHRWEEADGLGMKEIPAVVVVLNDAEAKKLTIALNEIHGRPDPGKLGILLDELKTDLDEDTFRLALPWSPGEIEQLIALKDVDWSQLQPPPAPPEDPQEWFTIEIRVPGEFRPVWEEVLADARKNDIQHTNPAVETGGVLQWLCANYLAGPRQ